jgi:hypothetical protein
MSERTAPLIRRSTRTRNKRDHGDIDVAFQLFSCGLVWDGNVTSKESRDHLIRNGYAVRYEGMSTLTGKGIVAFITSPTIWKSTLGRWRRWKRNPLIANADRIKRAMK